MRIMRIWPLVAFFALLLTTPSLAFLHMVKDNVVVFGKAGDSVELICEANEPADNCKFTRSVT
jgi:hypothetical protein